MPHPRLSIDSLSSINWTFDQEFALWRELGVRYAGIMHAKIAKDTKAKMARLREAGITPSTIVFGGFDLQAPETWEKTRAETNAVIDLTAAAGGKTAYNTPGRTTLAPWGEVLETYAKAIEPCVAYGKKRGVFLAMEPSLRTDVSFCNTLRDAMDVADRTGIGVVVDFGNCWMERDLAGVLKRGAKHVALVQFGDVKIGKSGAPGPGGRVHIGDGELPVHRMMEEVLATGYSGPFDLEVLGPAIEAEGYDSAIRRGVERASALLTEVGV